MVEAAIGDDLPTSAADPVTASSRLSRILRAQIADEIGVGVDRDQGRVGRHPPQHMLGEGADAGAIFDEQFAIRPVDRGEHLVDHRLGATG